MLFFFWINNAAFALNTEGLWGLKSSPSKHPESSQDAVFLSFVNKRR